MLGPIFFDRRGPESIVRSVRSILSLHSTGRGNSSSGERQKGSLSSTRVEEVGGQWHELDNRSQTTVSKNGAIRDQRDTINTPEAFQTTARNEV